MQLKLPALGVAVLVTVVAMAGIAGALGPASQSAADGGNQTIQVTASETVQASADKAVVRVAVVKNGDDIETVRNALADNASSLRSALSDMGLDDDQVRTSHYNIRSNHPHQVERGDPKFEAIHAFVVTVEDTDRVGEVVDTAVNSGANEINGVEFTLSAEKRQELRQQALGDAMDTARGEADTIASASGITVTGVHSVQTTEFHSSPYRTEAFAVTADAGGGTSIDSGPVTVRASVVVVYDADG